MWFIITDTNHDGEKENKNPKKKQVAKRVRAKKGTAAASKQTKPSKGKCLSISASSTSGLRLFLKKAIHANPMYKLFIYYARDLFLMLSNMIQL